MKLVPILLVYWGMSLASPGPQALAEEGKGYLTAPPTEQTACYRIDPNPERTLRVIRGGGGRTLVGKLQPHVRDLTSHGFGKLDKMVYPVDLTFQFNVLFYGIKQGIIPLSFPPRYFEESFWPWFRETRHYDSPLMKMDHLGYGDAETLDGVVYANADHLLVYDFDLDRKNAISDALMPIIVAAWRAEAGFAPEGDEDPPPPPRVLNEVKNLKADVYIVWGVPVVGVVKLDMSGEALGIKFHVGLDYTSDPQLCFDYVSNSSGGV